MLRIGPLVPAMLAGLLIGGAAAAGGGEVSLFLGQVSLDDNRLEDAEVDSATQFGVLATFDFDWPVALAVDVFAASDDATRDVSTSFPLAYDTEIDLLEVDLGVRRVFFRENSLQPYVGGGVAWIDLDAKQVQRGSLGPGADFEDTLLDDGDASLGYWLGAGAVYRFGKCHAGIDLRFSDASVDLVAVSAPESFEVEVGGMHYGVVFGYHW